MMLPVPSKPAAARIFTLELIDIAGRRLLVFVFDGASFGSFHEKIFHQELVNCSVGALLYSPDIFWLGRFSPKLDYLFLPQARLLQRQFVRLRGRCSDDRKQWSNSAEDHLQFGNHPPERRNARNESASPLYRRIALAYPASLGAWDSCLQMRQGKGCRALRGGPFNLMRGTVAIFVAAIPCSGE